MSFKGNIIKRKHDNGKFAKRKNLDKRFHLHFRFFQGVCRSSYYNHTNWILINSQLLTDNSDFLQSHKLHFIQVVVQN